MAKAPNLQAINARMTAGAERNLEELHQTADSIKALKNDPAYAHAGVHKQLDSLAAEVENKQQLLGQEIAMRQELDQALTSGDKPAIAEKRKALSDFRAAHKKDYAGGQTVKVCQPCVDKKLKRIPKVRTPQTPAQASDLITGVFEGREPDYCAIADSPTDAGGLSYGKHQAAEKKGGLYKMLSQYVNATDPAPDAQTKTKIAAHLAKFSPDHQLYTGTAAERADFKTAMKSACGDPAMRATQDAFFDKEYMQPAMKSAEALCINSALGKSMLYDLSIQSGPGRINSLAPKAMKAVGKPNAKSCAPCDPDGPSETEFLTALNDERRKFVTNLGGDAAKSVYREDFYTEQLTLGNTDFTKDFMVKGIPVKGLPTPH